MKVMKNIKVPQNPSIYIMQVIQFIAGHGNPEGQEESRQVCNISISTKIQFEFR